MNPFGTGTNDHVAIIQITASPSIPSASSDPPKGPHRPANSNQGNEDMNCTYSEYLAAKYPPKIRQRWRLLVLLEDHKVAQIAGWDNQDITYLRRALDTLCKEEPKVGRWPVLRLPLREMPGSNGNPTSARRRERRLVELGAIIARGSRKDLRPHWSDPATGKTYPASGIDLSPMNDLATRLESEAPELRAIWNERAALHDRIRRLITRMRRIVRAAVLDGYISEAQASAFRARLPKLPLIPDADAAEFSRLLKIGEALEADFRQTRATAMEAKHDPA